MGIRGRQISNISTRVIACLCLLLVLPAASLAQSIYMYADEYGRKTFSDRPLNQPGLKLIWKKVQEPKPSHNTDGSSPSAFDHHIEYAARTENLDPALIKAVIHAESYFDPNAVSRAGAQGLMQLMPTTAAQYQVTSPFDPKQNVMAGTRHLRELLERYNQNLRLALAAYNAGIGAVTKYQGVPPFKETQNYVKKVVELFRHYSGQPDAKSASL